MFVKLLFDEAERKETVGLVSALTSSVKLLPFNDLGDKKYSCQECEAAFSRSDHLKIHLKTHR